MIGIRLSRPLASLVAGRFGWRGAYLLEALAVCALLAALCRILPSRKPRRAQPYRVLVGSLHNLLATEPVLRRQALYQALCMASFGIFWSGVALRLAAAPFALSQTGIGLFMLSGAGGVVIAPIAGRLGDHGWSRTATAVAHGTVAVCSMKLTSVSESGAFFS
jgi:predicted MFS family arabinose efflux permease